MSPAHTVPLPFLSHSKTDRVLPVKQAVETEAIFSEFNRDFSYKDVQESSDTYRKPTPRKGNMKFNKAKKFTCKERKLEV